MIQMYKLHYGFHDKSLPDMFTQNTRASQGHNKKYKVKGSTKNIRKYNFAVKSIPLWNSLPQHVVDSEDIKAFEIALDYHWEDQDIMYENFKADVNIISNRRYADFQT